MECEMSETEGVEKNLDEQPEIVTKVTSVAQEELKTGEKFELPAPEVIANNAMAAYIKATQQLAKKLSDSSISKVSMAKGVLAGLDLPQEDVPVHLKTRDEVEIFDLMQTAINTRFILTQYHIDLRRRELQATKDLINSSKTTTEEGVSNV